MQLAGQIHRKEVFPTSGYRSSKEFFFLIVLEIFTGSGNALSYFLRRHPGVAHFNNFWPFSVALLTTTLLQPFNGLFSRTTWVSRYQKGKTNLDFTWARDSEWQGHQQLGHIQVCTSLQTDNHASTPPLCFFLQAGCPSCRPTNSVKALKAHCIAEVALNALRRFAYCYCWGLCLCQLSRLITRQRFPPDATAGH